MSEELALCQEIYWVMSSFYEDIQVFVKRVFFNVSIFMAKVWD